MRTIGKYGVVIFVAAALGLSVFELPSLACTLALVSGKAAANGRSLMWKNRDTSQLLNKLMFLKGPKYNFVALINSEDVRGGEAWAGMNDQGFAIMNSQADDLAQAERKGNGEGNGAFMRLALGECATADDFEKLLVREKGKWDLAGNFGIIDSAGNACFFETSRDHFTRFNAGDGATAPFGYLVRTNFAYTSPDYMKGGGFIRFERISHIMEAGRAANRLTARFILQEAARDLVHEKLHSFPLTRELPQDPARPLYVNTSDTINRNSTASAVVFEAAPSREQSHLAVMWVILGQAVSCVAVPVWPYSGTVPSAASAPEKQMAPLNAFSRKLVSFLYPDGRGRMPQYLNVNRLRTYGGEGVPAKILRIEDQIIEKAYAKMRVWQKEKVKPEQAASFQEELAAFALESLLKEFPDIR